MKKKVLGQKLSRGQGARTALYRSLVRAFVKEGKMTTTKAKAQFLTERLSMLVNKAKNDSLATRRDLMSFLGNDKETVDMLVGKVAKTFEKRTGGFVRIINLPRRTGDNAEIARIEWVEEIDLGVKNKDVSEKSEKQIKKHELKEQKNLKTEKTKSKRTKK